MHIKHTCQLVTFILFRFDKCINSYILIHIFLKINGKNKPRNKAVSQKQGCKLNYKHIQMYLVCITNFCFYAEIHCYYPFNLQTIIFHKGTKLPLITQHGKF